MLQAGRRDRQVATQKGETMLTTYISRLCRAVLAALLLSVALGTVPAYAIGWGPTDFIIADFRGGPNGGRIAVYDQNLVFKGYLDANFPAATGLDFLPNGNLVATGFNAEVKQYAPSGAIVSSFTDSRVGGPVDIK